MLGVAWWFSSEGGDAHRAKVPVPVFAIMFLVFVVINSVGVVPPPAKALLVEASRWGLLIAIAALGLNTSLGTILQGRPAPSRGGGRDTAVMFVIPLVWLLAMR